VILAQPETPEPRGAHLCHWTGCTRAVAPRYWGCRAHWRRLPAEIRDAIAASYRPGQESDRRPSIQYLAAARWAKDWIERNG
jgi:hypothetical protein